MEAEDLEETLKVVDSCTARAQWRLKPSAKRRLETDILSLCTGLRAVVLVDYGGKMPKLQERLCALLHLVRKESPVLLPLRVMVIDDMIYMIHVKGLAELASSSLRLEPQTYFVDLEQDPPKMLLHAEQNIVTTELLSIQKLFSSLFPVDADMDLLPVATPLLTSMVEPSECKDVDLSFISEDTAFHPSEIVDLSSVVNDTQITLPTLNGWLLGYPVVYLFRKENAADAIYNLSVNSLRIYKIVACRNQTPCKKASEEELTSFTVPSALSPGREKEPWAEAFLARMLAKFERCRHVWASMRLEVGECSAQAVVL